MTFSIPGDYRTKIQTSTNIGNIDSPFTRTRAVLDFSPLPTLKFTCLRFFFICPPLLVPFYGLG